MPDPGVATQPDPSRTAPERPHVVIVGSGFGGLFAARALRRARVRVTVVAATTHHLFQPLLYQVATGILSEGEIAPTTREVLRRQRNARVILGEVTQIDLAARTVTSHLRGVRTETAYDWLVVAAGAGQSYFGHDELATFAPGMKTIDDALELRGRIFGAFEMAEVVQDPDERARQLTFVVVGGGPTGVEMAGQIAELSRRTLRSDFRSVDPAQARVVLVDGADQVLTTFGSSLGGRARRHLEDMGVEVVLRSLVVGVDDRGVTVRSEDGRESRIESACKVWAAGVAGNPLGRQLSEQSGAELDPAGRVRVRPDLTLPGHPNVFVVGDMMALDDAPGVAQVAIQGGRYAADQIMAGDPAAPREAFRYRDKGSMATVSRFSAVASVGRVRLSGFVAWLAWLLVHLVYIIGFKSQLTVLLHWTVSFLGRGRSERTITRQQVAARLALQQLGRNFPPPRQLGPGAGRAAPGPGDDAGPPTRPR